MMNTLDKLFSKPRTGLLSIYFTAGYPALESTEEILRSLISNDVDLIEIGMPYSDPLADGPVIQQSSSKAIENGMSIEKLFSQLSNFRINNPNHYVPLILMGYLNPVMQFGFRRFCEMAKKTGISGIIIPDLPPEIYQSDYSPVFKEFGLKFIFLITPTTSPERINTIDEMSDTFLYAVSSSSITGRSTSTAEKENFLKRLDGLQNPVLTGFGIHDYETFVSACRYTNGAIIGTAYIEALCGDKTIEEATKIFLERIRTPIHT